MSGQETLDTSDYAAVQAHMVEKARELARTLGQDNDTMLRLIMEVVDHAFALGCQHEQARAESKRTRRRSE